MGCVVAQLPHKYLGLPWSLRKHSTAQLQSLIDSTANRLWHTKLLNRDDMKTLVQTTLSSILLHAMMSLDIPPKILEDLLKLCTALLWQGRQEVNREHCLIAWDKMTFPKIYGGLGIPNLCLLKLSLRC